MKVSASQYSERTFECIHHEKLLMQQRLVITNIIIAYDRHLKSITYNILDLVNRCRLKGAISIN